MKIIKIGLLITIIIGLSSCGGEFWEESKEMKIGPNRNFILNNEMLKDSISLGHFSTSDILEVQIEGKKLIPQFSEIYQKSFRSKWEKTVCFPDHCRHCMQHSLFMDCFNQTENGNCHHKYRDQITNLEEPLLFNELVVNLSLKFKIGKNLYPVGELINHRGNAITTRFQISKEMLLEDDEILLVITPEPIIEQVKVGFQGFGSCEGQGQGSFNSGGPTSSGHVPRQNKIEYQVSVILEQAK